MNKIYDNGIAMLGKVEDIKKMLLSCRDNLDDDTRYELMKELENYEEKEIVYINYDYCDVMNFNIDNWNEKDIVKECENNEN